MKRRQVVTGLAAVAGGAWVAVQAAPATGDLKPLGQDRYQLGKVTIDKAARRFSVPGRVRAANVPLEYLASSPGGMKAYEALLELDATGSEFNLACILVGLEPEAGNDARTLRSGKPLVGPRVELLVAWGEGAQRREVPAAVALLNPEAETKPESVEWVYIGAPASELTGRFPTDETGTLIGFSHDANCLIEAVSAVGIGAYGTVRGHAMLPPPGSAVLLTVQVPARRTP